jgi:Zn-dependent protease
MERFGDTPYPSLMSEPNRNKSSNFIPPDRSPRTPNEWGLLVVFSFFFTLLMALELVQNYSVAKLSVPFFLLSWVVLLVLHEFGHALMAKVVGWQILLVSIGHGTVRARLVVQGTPVEFRTLPLSGFVLPRPGDLVAPRLKQFLIYAAGPGIELLAVTFIVVLIGPDEMLRQSSELTLIAAQSFCVAALFGALFNLIPFPHQTAAGAAWSDGLGMILCWRISNEEFRRRLDAAE